MACSDTAQDRARVFASLIELKHERIARQPLGRRRSSADGGLRGQRQKLSPDDFEILGVLGRGAFAEVSLARKRDTGAIYAMKKMRKADLVSRGHVERAWTEWMVQSEADGNEWLVKLHFCFQTAEHVYLVMDYVPGGDMMGLFMRLDTLPEQEARFYAAQTVQAIESLHRLGYAHRDIKPDNLLLDANGHLKLADLGLAKCTESQLRSSRSERGSFRENSETDLSDADPGSPNAAASPTLPATPPAAHPDGAAPGVGGAYSRSRCELFSRVGTPDYMAPEVLTRSGYGRECDWWSFGCILYEMLVGYAPFYAETAQETADKVLRYAETLAFPPEATLSSQARLLITQLITKREERIGIDDIKSHPFFVGIDWEGLREMVPPHTPTILSETDTQHFEEFEPATPGQADAEPGPTAAAPRDTKAVLFAGFNFSRAS